MSDNIKMEKEIFLSICEREDWDAICGEVSVNLDDFYRICDILADYQLFCLMDIFTAANYNLIEEDVEKWKDLAGLELIPEELLKKLEK